jgi:hypothetical protein
MIDHVETPSNTCTTLTSCFAAVEAVMVKEGVPSDVIADFKNDWWAGAFDTVHVIFNLIKANNPEGLKVLHEEVHTYIDAMLDNLDLAEGEKHVKH